MIRAFAAHEPGGRLERFDFEPGDLQSGQVEIDVVTCGICHSDLSMLEHFPLSRVNEAMDRLRAGKARYRIVLDNDLG